MSVNRPRVAGAIVVQCRRVAVSGLARIGVRANEVRKDRRGVRGERARVAVRGRAPPPPLPRRANGSASTPNCVCASRIGVAMPPPCTASWCNAPTTVVRPPRAWPRCTGRSARMCRPVILAGLRRARYPDQQRWHSHLRINVADPGPTATDLNDHRGSQTVEQGAVPIVRAALIDAEGPTDVGASSGRQSGERPSVRISAPS